MPLSLVRIDDRLIHGQVVLGWGRVLKPDRIVVANDRVAENDWERRLYQASVPAPTETEFFTVKEASARIQSGVFENAKTLLLFESIADLHRSAEAGARFEEVNVGGLHYREGARAVLPYVYLSDSDRTLLKDMIARGIKFMARDIPGNPAVDLSSLVCEPAADPPTGA